METGAETQLFATRIRSILSKVHTRFFEMEQQLLEQKSFEDMAFNTSGFCENGDFFYTTECTGGPTAREQLADYFDVKEHFDQFISGLNDQVNSVKPENRLLFESWVQEQV